MKNLTELLLSITNCRECGLMVDNMKLSIPLIPFLPKPEAEFVFVGRDPSPSVSRVGVRGGKSVFINEIFDMVDESKIAEELIYVTSIC